MNDVPARKEAEVQPGGAEFDPNTTAVFQAKMKNAPEWFCSMMAGTGREKRRLRDELLNIRGAWPLLMKQRNGGKWTPEDKAQLAAMVRSASSVSPYVFIWALPGSVVMLPFLAWYLDRARRRQQKRLSKAAGGPGA